MLLLRLSPAGRTASIPPDRGCGFGRRQSWNCLAASLSIDGAALRADTAAAKTEGSPTTPINTAKRTARTSLRPPEVRELPLQVRQLRQVPVHDVRMVRVLAQEALVVILGRIEAAAFDAGDDRAREGMGGVEL